jgi:hypothetical protein
LERKKRKRNKPRIKISIMSLKEFLKPDWRKIVIMIILTAVPFFISPLVGKLDALFSFFFKPFTVTDNMLIMSYTKNFGMNMGIIEMASGIFGILDAIYAYVISCIIILIYDILKKK